MAGRQGPYRRDFNSTDYVHPNEENLNNLHCVMEYNDAGEPHLRVKVDAGIISVDEINLGVVEIANDEGDPVPVSGTVSVTEPVAVTDNGGSLTVDGTVSVNNFPATQTVDGTVGITGNVNVTQGTDPWIVDGSVTANVSGTVSVSNFPSTQTIDGTVNIGTMPDITINDPIAVTDNGGSITVDGNVSASVSGTVSVDNFPATQTINGTVNLSAGTLSALENTTVSVSNFPNTQTVDGTVSIDNFPTSQTVDGTVGITGNVNVTQGTDPWTVTGTVALNSSTLSALENITATIDNFPTIQTIDGTVTVQDGGGSITVDGSVTASVSGTVSVDNFPDTQTVDGTVDINSMPDINIDSVSVDNFPTSQTVDGTVDVGNEVAINDGGNSITVDGTVEVTGGPGAFPSEVIGTDPYGASVIRIDDTTKQHTSKNRVKVSQYEITDFITFTRGKDPDIWDEAISGTASSTHNPYLGMVELEVGSTAGDEIVRQTRRVQRYIPGRQGEVSATMIFGTSVTGIRKRFGLFDEFNGFFFEDSNDGTYKCCLRRNTASGVVTEVANRNDWNVDKLDGTGPSGITLDPTAIQHISIEYEWYGAGMIEWNFIINNNKYAIHRTLHANVHGHTWAAKAALPVRVEITNVSGTAGTHTFYQGSHSFSVEGSTELLGRQNSISNDITGKRLQSSNTFYPMVAIRLKNTALDSVVIPDEFAAATLDNTDIFVRVIEDAAITGGTWVSFGNDSAVEYNITATSFSGGNTLGTTYVSSNNLGEKYTFAERSITQLQRNTTSALADTSGTFLIAVSAKNSNKDGWASLGWIEVR